MSDKWLPPEWNQRDWKHRPPRNKDWGIIRKETDVHPYESMYYLDMTEKDIEAIEMSFIEVVDGQKRERRFVYLRDAENAQIKYHWAYRPGKPVGASYGEDTHFVLIQRCKTGPVHGYPVSWQDIVDSFDNDKSKQKFLREFPNG